MKRMTTAFILATCCTTLMGCMPETATDMQHQALPVYRALPFAHHPEVRQR